MIRPTTQIIRDPEIITMSIELVARVYNTPPPLVRQQLKRLESSSDYSRLKLPQYQRNAFQAARYVRAALEQDNPSDYLKHTFPQEAQ